MDFMVLFCKVLAHVLGFVAQSHVAPSPIHSGMSNRVNIRAMQTLQCCLTFAIGSVGLVTRFGQFYKSVDPGLVQVNVCTESLRVVDVKIQISPIGRQTVITRDNVNVEMWVSYHVLGD
jgi:hypothetical protein